MNAGRPRPRRRLEREVHQCLPEDDGLRSAHGRGGPGSRPRRRPSRRCSKRRPLVVELGEVAGEGRILERPDPSSLASRRRAVGVGRSSVGSRHKGRGRGRTVRQPPRYSAAAIAPARTGGRRPRRAVGKRSGDDPYRRAESGGGQPGRMNLELVDRADRRPKAAPDVRINSPSRGRHR